MDAALLSEIKLLESNRNKIENTTVYDLLIHSIKGKYVCEEKRKNFVISRSIPNDKIYQPYYVEPKAKEFLDCYAGMIQTTKDKCHKQYETVFQRISKNSNKSENFPIKCVPDMEDFINC